MLAAAELGVYLARIDQAPRSDLASTPTSLLRGLRPAVALIALLALARLAYLAWFCPYTLAEDEAHYWEWSRHLDWSYYSKGPGIAWLIAATTKIAGASELGVRLGAVLAGALVALGLAGLAWEVSRSRRAALLAAALAHLAPIFQASGLLATIDMPYAACWSLACWAAWRAFTARGTLAWLALGLALGAGLLFKHTMLLLAPGLLLWAIGNRRVLNLAPGFGPWAWLALLLALAGLAPNIIWNAGAGWPTLRHLLGHLGLAGGDVPAASGGGGGWSPWWLPVFLLTQLALVGPALALALLCPRGTSGRSFLLWCAAPVFAFYALVSLWVEPEGNWAMAGHTTLLALAAVAADDAFVRRDRGGVALWRASLIVGVITGLGMLRLDLLGGPERFSGLGRVLYADRMAAHVQRLRERLRAETGLEPMIVSQYYGRASQMSFYLPDRPAVFGAGSRMGGRASQYDLWPHTDLANPLLAGRPAVLLGDQRADWSWGFERVEPLGRLEGESKRGREVFLGYGYRPPGGRKP